MFARKSLFSSISRAAVVATVAAVALTAFEPSTARAGSAPAGKGLSTAGDQRRHRLQRPSPLLSWRRRWRRAAAAAFAGIVGTGIAIAATQNRRDYYYDGGPVYYGGGPVYYGGGPVYYGGGPAYYGGGPTMAAATTAPRRCRAARINGHPIASW